MPNGILLQTHFGSISQVLDSPHRMQAPRTIKQNTLTRSTHVNYNTVHSLNNSCFYGIILSGDMHGVFSPSKLRTSEK